MKVTYILIFLSVLLTFVSCDRLKHATPYINYSDIERHIVRLSSDEFMGRKPFTKGEELSVNYISAEFKKIGLLPAFEGSFFQKVPMVDVFSNTSNVKLKIANALFPLNASEDFAIWSPKFKEQVSISDVEMIFAGYGIVAEEYDWNDFEGIDVKDKVIVVLSNDPGLISGDPTFFRGKEMTYYGRWTYKFEEAARQGAKGVLIVHTDEGAGYPWHIVDTRNSASQLYLNEEGRDAKKCDFEGWLTYEAAIKTLGLADFDNPEAIFEDVMSKKIKNRSMKMSISLDIENRLVYNESMNVAGMIEGSEKPDECIIYTAHWDHLGICPPDKDGDSIVNGASDNAAAIAWMMEIAEQFVNSKTPPKKSILFISPTAEESGLLGSQWYVDHPVFSLEKTIACFNSDVILFLGKFKDFTITGFGQSELDDIVAEFAKKQGRYIAADPQPENGMLYRSDQLPYMKKGIPSMFGKGYTDQEELGKEETMRRIIEYWKNTYHKPCDEYVKERDKLDGLVDDARLMYSVGRHIIDRNVYPNWKETSEFKNARN